MPRDHVSERRHRKSLRRKKVRIFELMKDDGSGKHAHGPMGNDPFPAPGTPHRPARDRRGPKKFKFKRDVIDAGKARW